MQQPIWNTTTGGYIATLVSTLPQKLKCALCYLLMREPIQTYRGEMACESCYESAKGKDNICPIDHEPIKKGETFKDRHTRREILNLQCYCSNKQNGCIWESTVNNLEGHLSECIYNVICCEKCGEHVLRKDNEEHVNNRCRFRQIICSYCSGLFDAELLLDHESTCHLRPMDCPYMCGKRVASNDLFNHVESCQNIISGIVCPFQLVGCKYQPHSKCDLNQHLQMESIVHAALTASVVKYQQTFNDKIKEELITEQQNLLELTKKMEEHSIEKKAIEVELSRMQEKNEDMERECAALKELCDSSVRKMENDLKDINLRTEGSNLRDINSRLTAISKEYEDVESKLKNNGNGMLSTNGIDPEEIKKGVEAIDKLESGSAMFSANLSDMELKLQFLENTCYGGRQIWKIDNVSYRMNQAVTGKVTALHSAPCFQQRGGYKFCSRLYLNGDGMGRGTHVSLFFVVMKSEYDALLTWPFAERVTFRLINPYNSDESIRESFIPDKNSSSFMKPTKDMNIAAGCPMMVRREKLNNFIVDDVLYIETVITSD